MPRSRVVKPEFWNDEKLAKVSRDARLTFIGVWTCSDDYGVTKGNEAWLKSQIYPYEDGIKLAKFEEWLGELEKLKVIIPFKFHEEKFYYIKNFSKHQKVDHPSKNRNPEPPEDIESETYSYLSNILAKDSRGFRDETEYKQKQNINRKETESREFDEFWKVYPIKTAKNQALKTWKKLAERGDLAPLQDILDSIKKQIVNKENIKRSGQFCPEWKHPATWLNGGCWGDELIKENHLINNVKYLDPKADAEKYG